MPSSTEIINAALKEKRPFLFEHEAKEVARSVGIVVPRFEIIPPGNEAALAAAADKLGYPVALKAESPQVLHKTEAGALALDVKNKTDLSVASKRITENVSKAVPGAVIRHFLIEKMMPSGPEVLIGGLRDQQFGTCLAFGIGGIWTEAIRDAAFGILPLSLEELIEMMDQTRASLFFKEHRGTAALDRQPTLKVMQAVADLMQKHQEISEIDLNPVRLYFHGAAALDVRIVLAV